MGDGLCRDHQTALRHFSVAQGDGLKMYRRINPKSQRELPLRMLYQRTSDGLFHRACEADSFRGLVAALLDDPAYEGADVETRLGHRLRLADELRLLADLEGIKLEVGDHDEPVTINVASDEPLIRSLDRLGFASLDPSLRDGGVQNAQR